MTVSEFFKQLLKDTYKACLIFFKILIPVSVAVKILKETGLINIIGEWLSPVMKLMGLPGELGIVWFTAMASNIYGGIIALFSTVESGTMTVGQMTIIMTVIMFAHALPVEGLIAHKAGAKIFPQIILRITVAFITGILLNQIFKYFGLYNNQAHPFLKLDTPDESLQGWILSELSNYAKIAMIIFGLLLFVRILQLLNIDKYIASIISPLLSSIGIGKDVTTLTIISMLTGLSYGGAIIIVEAKQKKIDKKNIFYAMCLIGICHSLIEDSLIPIFIDARWLVILISRIIMGIIITRIVVLATRHLSNEKFYRYFINK